MFTDGTVMRSIRTPSHRPFERIARRAGMSVIRLHDVRHTYRPLLIAAGVPVKVVSERLGQVKPTSTIETSSTCCRACSPRRPACSSS